MQGGRFRHTAQFRRWRTDKKAEDADTLESVQKLLALTPGS
jgi:ATP-dependent DNA ligase